MTAQLGHEPSAFRSKRKTVLCATVSQQVSFRRLPGLRTGSGAPVLEAAFLLITSEAPKPIRAAHGFSRH